LEPVTLGAATVLDGGTAAITTGAVTGGGFGLTIQGSGADTIASTSGVGALALNDTGGSVTVTGNLGAASVSTAATAFNVALNGGTNSVTGTSTFSNTGSLVIGAAAGTSTFAGGLSATT